MIPGLQKANGAMCHAVQQQAAQCYRSALLGDLWTRLMGSIRPYILYGKRTEELFLPLIMRAYMMNLNSMR